MVSHLLIDKEKMNELENFKKNLAIVILAYSDYESLELAMASHARFTVNSGVDIYILQNGRGTYDCERTYAVARRYNKLFPDKIFVVDNIEPGIPFYSLKALFSSEEFNKYSHIIKLDDDVMVLSDNWVDKLCECYLDSKFKYGKDFAYATSLVNNNPYGFGKIIEKSKELSAEYFEKIAIRHYVGDIEEDAFAPRRILSKDEICTGANGTIWGYPHIAKWLHRKTTLRPEWYVNFALKQNREEVNNKERYSINCLLFDKKIWIEELEKIEPACTDDEHLLHAYCLKYNKKIIAELSIPMVHLCFFSQRSECRDMYDDFRECYEKFLQLPFDISMCKDRKIEIENRLRFMENQQKQCGQKKKGKIYYCTKCIRHRGLVYTIKYAGKKIIRR